MSDVVKIYLQTVLSEPNKAGLAGVAILDKHGAVLHQGAFHAAHCHEPPVKALTDYLGSLPDEQKVDITCNLWGLAQMVNEGWTYNWANGGWKSAKGREIPNASYIKKLHRYVVDKRISMDYKKPGECKIIDMARTIAKLEIQKAQMNR